MMRQVQLDVAETAEAAGAAGAAAADDDGDAADDDEDAFLSGHPLHDLRRAAACFQPNERTLATLLAEAKATLTKARRNFEELPRALHYMAAVGKRQRSVGPNLYLRSSLELCRTRHAPSPMLSQGEERQETSGDWAPIPGSREPRAQH
jgi:hypothetical protein